MDEFRKALEEWWVEDLGFEGDIFTWRNNQFQEDGFIRERLDRAVANLEWRCLFPEAQVVNGDPRHSDHRPLIIQTKPPETLPCCSGGGSFRFEAAWIEEEKCREVIESAWLQATTGGGGLKVASALTEVASSLSNWSANALGDMEKRRKRLQQELESCHRGVWSKENVEKEGVLCYRLEKIEEQIDTYWRQRAHTKWMQMGDKNTAFFHASCSERKRKNKIGKLKKETGAWVEEEEEKRSYITN